MLTAERNESLTRVGRGTLIGETRRRLMDAASAVARGVAPPGLDPAVQGARAVSMVASRQLSLPDAVAAAQKDPAKTVSAA